MKFVDLSSVEDKALYQELERRRVERARIEKEKRQKRADFLLSQIDAILALTPEHKDQKCSDNSLRYYRNECTRCRLLDIKRSDWWDPNLEVSIVFTENESEED